MKRLLSVLVLFWCGLACASLPRDSLARLGSSWTQTNEAHFIYAGMDVIQERSSNNVPLVKYTRGYGLLARTDAGGPLYYHTDGNNNVTSMVDGNGNPKARYTYDSYGNLIAKSGPMRSEEHTSESSHRPLSRMPSSA